MAFQLSPITDIEFDIPAGKDKSIRLTVPPLDTFTPAQLEDIAAEMEKIPEDTPEVRNPKTSAHAQTRFLLCFFNPGKEKHNAIWALGGRHVQEITDYWNKESGITLGESEPSTDTSSGKTE